MSSTQQDRLPTLFLYDHPISSYAQKVRMALRLKSLPFTSQTPPNLGSGQPNASFQSANPRLEVPALVITKPDNSTFKVFDSTAILMYLEDAFPFSPSLLPDSAEDRAQARMIEEICDTHYEAINWALGEIKWFKRAEGAEADRLIAAAKDQTEQIQTYLSTFLSPTKPFFSGDRLGYTDLCVAPILNRSIINSFAPPPNSPLALWLQRISSIPCIAETFAEVEAAAPMMAKMGPEAWKKGAGRRREYRDHRLEWMVKNGAMEIVEKGLRDGNVRFSWPYPREELHEQHEQQGRGKL